MGYSRDSFYRFKELYDQGREQALMGLRGRWVDNRMIAWLWMPLKYGCGSLRVHYDSHDPLRAHLNGFFAAWNFACRPKTLNRLTPYEYICKKPDIRAGKVQT